MKHTAFSALTGLALMPILAISAVAQPKVVVTIKPIHALVAQVMDGIAVPALLVDGTASPHTFSLKPSDVKRLNDADIVVRVSEALEPFTAKIVKSLPRSVEVISLEKAQGLRLLNERTGATFEPDADDHGHGSATARDGHIWLDPANARIIVDRIAEILGRRDAAHADAYKANAAKAKAAIDALDAELATDLKPLAGKPFVVFHDAYQYLEKRYGLAASGSITTNPEIPPSGKRLTALRQKIAKLSVQCVFSEPNFEAKVAASVIEGSKAKMGVLDPEGARLAAGPELYGTLMRNLAKGLKDCLGEPQS